VSARALPTSLPNAKFDWLELGAFPTPVDRVSVAAGELFIKRDDLSSPVYGGNKVRTLETLFGQAKASGATRIYATGAFGSNHATATVLHAPRVGLEAGVILFPQPKSTAAEENLRVILGARPVTVCLPHWSFLPLGMMRQRRRDRSAGVASEIMVPGGATEVGAIGYVSAALELAQQVEDGELPSPARLVIGVGSTCTSAGLLLGLRVAAILGIGWREPPRLISARVTPWPVTSPYRIVDLAVRTGALLAARSGDRRLAVGRRTLRRGLEVDRRYLGWGYGHATKTGRAAIETFRASAGFELDTTYSAKAAACALDRVAPDGPTLFWSTKSTAGLPDVPAEAIAHAPKRMRRWLR